MLTISCAKLLGDIELLLDNPSKNQNQIINYLTTSNQSGYSFILMLFNNREHRKVKAILSFLQGHPVILQEVLMQKNKFGYSVLMQAIYLGNPEIINNILSSLKTNPLLLRKVLMQKNNAGYPVFRQAISSQNPEIINNILSSLKTNPLLLRKVLMQRNKAGYPVFKQAISSQNHQILNSILSSLKDHPVILQEVLMQKDDYDYPVLMQAIYLENPEIINNILSSLKDHPVILQEVLMQKDCNGRSLFNYAIFEGNLQIVKKILSVVDEQTRDIIFNELDSNGDKVLFMAMKMVNANDYPKNINREEILKLLVKNKFNIDLDQSQISALISFYKKHALLGLMSQDEYGIDASQNPHNLTKILNEVVASSESQDLRANSIAQIYAKEIIKVNTNRPILIHDNDALYLYKSNSFAHSSYVVFNVDQDTNILKSISYCDGNFYPELGDERPHQNSLLLETVFGVREFKLKDKVKFSKEFAQKFIKENFQDKDLNLLKLPFMVDSQTIAIKGITRCTRTRKQRRGNCAFKSANILARYLLQKQTGEDYSKDYQDFKTRLRSQVIKGLVQDYKKVKEQLGEEFVEHLGVEKRLKEVAKKKFGNKEPKLFENAIADLRLRPESKPNQSTKASCFSCLGRVFSRTNKL